MKPQNPEKKLTEGPLTFRKMRLVFQLPFDIIIPFVFLFISLIMHQPFIMASVVVERPFSPMDSSISFPLKPNIVSIAWLIVLIIIDFLVVPLLAYLFISASYAYALFINGLTMVSLLNLAVQFMKVTAARLRPDFLSRCDYSMRYNKCMGDPSLIFEGRMSFPSGHSASSMFASFFLAIGIYLIFIHRYDRWRFQWQGALTVLSRSAWLSIASMPLFFGTFVAISRTLDNSHHVTDVMAGSVIGIAFIVMTYVLTERAEARACAEGHETYFGAVRLICTDILDTVKMMHEGKGPKEGLLSSVQECRDMPANMPEQQV